MTMTVRQFIRQLTGVTDLGSKPPLTIKMHSSWNFDDYACRLGATVSSFAMATSTLSLRGYLLLVVPFELVVPVSAAMPLHRNCTQQ
jgi:hypothetical protein